MAEDTRAGNSDVAAHPPASQASLPGLGFAGAMATAFSQTLLLLARNRLLWLLLLGELITGVIAFGLAGFDRNRLAGHDLFCLLAWWFQSWVVLPWATMYLVVQAIHGDVEDRTVQYLFLRPVSRGALLLGKWLAASVLAATLVGAGVAVLFVGVAAVPDIWGDGIEFASLGTYLWLTLCGALAYGAFGCWFSATFRRPLVWAAVFVVSQMIAALLPVAAGVRALTVSDPLRRLLIAHVEPDSRLERILWPGDRALRDEVIGNPVLALAILTTVLLALALYRYRRAEYDARDRE
ncbi:MAG: ABC transporter permease [bacterium]|nr:ABC transporter permease [bacterium]